MSIIIKVLDLIFGHKFRMSNKIRSHLPSGLRSVLRTRIGLRIHRMQSLTKTFKTACGIGDIPGVVLLAKDKSGQLDYAQPFGTRSIKDPDSRPPMTVDTVMRVASATKLVTTVAALQCVDRGLIGLDDPDAVDRVEELRDIQVIKGFDGDKPILEHPKSRITLRRLLTHTSGFCYDSFSPLIRKWREVHGQELQPETPTVPSRFHYPLVSDPGTDWVYAPGLDWTGRLIERVTGMGLEDFIKLNIFRPLGMAHSTYFLQSRPDMIAARVEMTLRNKETGQLEYSYEPYWYHDPEDAFGGLGLKTTPTDFMQLLHSLLLNNGQLLSPAMVDEMFKPQLSDELADKMTRFLTGPGIKELLGRLLPKGVRSNFGMGGVLAMEDVSGGDWRQEGSLTFFGLPNFNFVSTLLARLYMINDHNHHLI